MLRIARAYGADHTIDVENENTKQRIKELTNGKGADIVVDVTPYAVEPVAESLSYVRAGGTIVLAGMKGYKDIPGFVSDLVMMKEITIKGVIGVTSTGYEKAIRLIESGKYKFERQCTHRFPIEETERALKTVGREGEPGALHVSVVNA